MLRGAILQRAPRGKLLKILELSTYVCTHNAEVEGSRPSLTIKINELQLLKRGILREVAGLAQILAFSRADPNDLARRQSFPPENIS